MEKEAVQVTILGHHYSFKSDAADDVVRVADFVNRRIDEVLGTGRAADSLNAAILTLMNVAGELMQLRSEGGTQDPDTLERLEKLLERLEHAEPAG